MSETITASEYRALTAPKRKRKQPTLPEQMENAQRAAQKVMVARKKGGMMEHRAIYPGELRPGETGRFYYGARIGEEITA